MDDSMEIYGGLAPLRLKARHRLPAPDALQEFKLEEGNYSVQFGHSTGSVLDAVIKSGSNTYNGDLWEYVQISHFNANDWFQNHNNTPGLLIIRICSAVRSGAQCGC